MIGGLFVYIHTEFFPEALDFKFLYPDESALSEAEKLGQDFQKKINYYLFKYQSPFYVAMLPFLALISRLVFIDKKQYNLSVHFVITIYAYSQMSIIINSIYILFFWNSKVLYYSSMGIQIFQIGFFTWVFYSIFNLSVKQILLKLFFYLLIFLVLFILLMIFMAIYMVVFTDFFQHLSPK